MSLRSPDMEERYKQAKKDGQLIPLASEAKLAGAPDFDYWKVITNRFPHNRHHTVHMLVVLKRDCDVLEVSLEELEELWFGVLPWADNTFDYVKFNLSSMRSVNNTPHLHLYILKAPYK